MESETVQIEESVIEEERSILSKIVVAKNFDWVNKECLVVVIKVDKTDFCDNLSNIEVCGKSVLDWVLMSTCGPEQKVIEDQGERSLLETLKNISQNKSYVFVAYSDTPFLQRSTFLKIMDYVSASGINALELPRGYVFKASYLKNLTTLSCSMKKTFSDGDFVMLTSAGLLSSFFDFTASKIRAFHKKNGVTLFGEETIFIDADVEIEKGTIIYPNNVLKGETSIGKNVVLRSGNLIENSVIFDDAQVEGSVIISSKVSRGKGIPPLTKLNNESV